MTELPPPWGAYARLQEELSRRTRVDRAWGLEAALDELVAGVRSDADADRIARSTNRKERHRARLRRIHLVDGCCQTPPEEVLDARRALRTAEATLTRADWALLTSVAAGHSYAELAAATSTTPGALRVRTLRLRRLLQPLLATQGAPAQARRAE